MPLILRIPMILALAATVCLGGVGPGRAQAVGPTEPASPTYKLGPGDKLRIITFGEQALSGEFFVAGSGKVAMPLIGEVQAGGLPISAFREQLETKLRAGYLNDPRVSVEILSYRPFYILGEVNKPGEYPYTTRLTVLNAVATANGFTYRANRKSVCIKSADAADENCQPLESDTAVRPGDTVRIKERFF